MTVKTRRIQLVNSVGRALEDIIIICHIIRAAAASMHALLVTNEPRAAVIIHRILPSRIRTNA